MSRTFLLSAFCLAVLAVTPGGVFAAETAAPLPILTLRTGEHPAFDRVVFDAPRGVTYKVSKDGAEVRVVFSIAAKLTLSSMKLKRVKGLSVASGADGLAPLAVKFRVAPDAKLKDFMSGTSIVIDVVGASVALPSSEKKPEKKEAPAVQAPEPKKEEPEPVSEDAASVSVVSEPEKEQAPEAVKEKASQLSSPPDSSDSVMPPPVAAPVAEVREEPPPQTAPQQTEAAALDPKEAASILEITREKDPKPVLSLDPKILVGAAIYARAGIITILFDRKLAPPPFMAGAPQRVKVEPLELSRNSGFRIAVPDGVDVRATRTGTAWEIFLTRAGGGAGVSTEFVAQPDFALGARLLLATANPPDPIFMDDPVVGDRLLVIPFRETGAFTLPRQLADFQVIPSAQGLVIKPLHEKVQARIVPDGIEITSEGGLKLSSAFDTGTFKSGEKGAPLKTLFDLHRWRGRSTDGFTQTRQRLMQTIVDVPEEQRLLARMDLARFYFAYGMGNESLALLNMIAKELPEIETKPDFLALRGAARVLAGQAAEGAVDLAKPELADQPEALLWAGIAAAMERDWRTAAARFTMSFSILNSYPEPFRARFIILAVESALANGQDKEASAWLLRLERSAYPEKALPAIRYLRGVLYSKSGKMDRAEKLWREVARGKDRLYKIRAELALVDLGVATKSLSSKQAVDRLEGLRFAWRGDDLEFDILRRLGGFYVGAKEFRTGLLMLGQALRLYPSSPQAAALKAEMSRLFKDIILTPLGDGLSPLEALGLYTDFKNLIPEGEEGNKVRRKLAESLVDIDLLDQAGKLFEDIAKNSSKPEEKAQIITRLAAVKLLDRDAIGALAALDQSQAEAAALSPAAQEERQLLRARALSEMGKYDEALAALPSQESQSAKLLKADIALRGKHWSSAADTLLELVGAPPLEGKPVSEDRAGWLVNAALAVAQSGDAARLDKLATDYGRAMAQTSKADLFFLIARPESGGQMKNLAAAQAKLSEVDMFKGFLDSYRKAEGKP